jgi:hypothetical protein
MKKTKSEAGHPVLLSVYRSTVLRFFTIGFFIKGPTSPLQLYVGMAPLHGI